MNNFFDILTILYCKERWKMNKKEAWDKFKETGKIEYYLKYKKGK